MFVSDQVHDQGRNGGAFVSYGEGGKTTKRNERYDNNDPFNMLLKPKRHSLRCHDFMVHA